MKLCKFFLIFSLFILLSGCGDNNVSSTYSEITVDEAYEMIESNEDVVVLDVRTLNEYNDGHLVGAINVPLDEINNDILDKVPNKETSIIVYCKSGVRALEASKLLVNLGYINIYTFGGINSWNYEIE